MFIRRSIATLAIILLAGCASSTQAPTEKEKTKEKWNAARAAVIYSLAKSQFEGGNLDACRKSINEAASMDGRNTAIHLLSARLYIEQGQLEPAEKELQLCREIDPKNAESHYYSGVIYQRWERPQAALECYAKASELAPAELAYLLAHAEMLVALDQRTQAIALLQNKLAYYENSPAIRDAVGQLLVQEGRYDAGAVLLRQASVLAPDELNVREHFALALYFNKEYREAASTLERLLKEPSCSNRADLQLALGECLMLTDRPREARECFQIAAQLQPGTIGVWLSLAKAGLQLGDLPRVELSVRKAISLEPNNPEAQLSMGYLRLRQNQLDDAIASFRKASALDPKDPVSVCMIGFILEKKGRPTEALDYYAKALKIRPDDELATTLMAQLETDN